MIRAAAVCPLHSSPHRRRRGKSTSASSGGQIIYTQDPCPANTKPGRFRAASFQGPPPHLLPRLPTAPPRATRPRAQAPRRRPNRNRRSASASRIRPRRRRNRTEIRGGQRKAENCRNARERLTQYEIGGRQSRINEKGERYISRRADRAGKARGAATSRSPATEPYSFAAFLAWVRLTPRIDAIGQ